MKRYELTFCVIIWLGLILVTPLAAQLPFVEPEQEREDNIDMYWKGWLTPEQYRDAYEYVTHKMPDEFDEKRDRSIARTTAWTPIGPTRLRIDGRVGWHGRIRCFKWWRNTTTGTWEPYAGSSSGGLWFGDFALIARAWVPLGNNLPNPSVGAFEIHPNDRNTIFVGTGDWARYGGSGLYRTTDRGSTWTRIPLNAPWGEETPGSITAIYYGRNTDTMLLAGDRGFYRSINGGATWNLSQVTGSNPRAAIFSLVVDPTRPEILYAALPGIGIFKSINTGRTWTPIDSGITIAGTGQTLALDISRTNPSVLYAAFSDGGGNFSAIYKTTNGGGVWNATTAPPSYMNNGQGFHANAIRIHPSDANVVYAGSVGFVRSTDGGRSWTERNAGHSDLQWFDFLPGDPRYVYIGSDGGLFIHNNDNNDCQNLADYFLPYAPIQAYAIDYGWSASNVVVGGTQDNGTLLTERAFESESNWRSIGGCDGANNINIDPNGPNLIYFNSWCGPNPRLRTADMGRTGATNINSGLDEIYYSPIRMDKGNNNYLFTVTSEKLCYSINKGDQWLRATANGNASSPTPDFTATEAPRSMVVNYGSGGTVVAYVWFWDLYPPRPRSDGTYLKIAEGTPGSMVWRRTRLPGNEVIKIISPDRWNPDVAYATTDNVLRIYRTTDRGRTWKNITGNMPSINTVDVASSPANPEILYAATDLGVFKTRNPRDTTNTRWYRYQYGLPVGAVNGFAYIPGPAYDTLRISTFGHGFWQRVLAGDDPLWIELDTSTLAVRFRDIATIRTDAGSAWTNNAIAVADSGAIARTTNGGRTWDYLTGLIPGTLRGVAANDCTMVVAVGDNGAMIRSSDMGYKWQHIQVPTKVDLNGICLVDSLVGFACGNEGVILKTETGGTQWYEVASGKGEHLTKIVFTDQKSGWVIGDFGPGVPIMRRTTDGGKTWNGENGFGVVANAMQFVDQQTAYAVGEGGKIFKTTDGGNLWENLKSGVQDPLYGCFFFSPDSGWVCGAGGIVLKTGDGGKTWQQEGSDTDGDLYAISPVPEYMLMAGDSVILRRYLLPEPLSGVRNGAAPMALELHQNRPNPFTGETQIGFTLPHPTRARVTIFNAIGELIAELPERAYAAGTYENIWDGTDIHGAPVPAGIYLYRLTTPDATRSRQMVVVR